MADASNTRVIRVPNLPVGQLIDETGHATDDFLTYLQALTQSLQQNYGAEGLVMPTQTDTNITTIQNNQDQQGRYTCQYGTLIYDETNNSIRVAVNNGADAPIFKTVTIT